MFLVQIAGLVLTGRSMLLGSCWRVAGQAQPARLAGVTWLVACWERGKGVEWGCFMLCELATVEAMPLPLQV